MSQNPSSPSVYSAADVALVSSAADTSAKICDRACICAAGSTLFSVLEAGVGAYIAAQTLVSGNILRDAMDKNKSGDLSTANLAKAVVAQKNMLDISRNLGYIGSAVKIVNGVASGLATINVDVDLKNLEKNYAGVALFPRN